MIGWSDGDYWAVNQLLLKADRFDLLILEDFINDFHSPLSHRNEFDTTAVEEAGGSMLNSPKMLGLNYHNPPVYSFDVCKHGLTCKFCGSFHAKK
jgi:hypothetical protein